MESRQVDFSWLCKVDWALNPGVQEDTVQVRVGVGDPKVDYGQILYATVAYSLRTREATNSLTNLSIFCRSVMSNFTA